MDGNPALTELGLFSFCECASQGRISFHQGGLASHGLGRENLVVKHRRDQRRINSRLLQNVE